ncbi:MAG: hypothetical protein IPL49_17930 [Saprospirales bacterium]|nr:hypothetical protein [Saprospirales bacterium]
MNSSSNAYEQEDFCEKFRISVDAYHRMGEIGIFDDQPRVGTDRRGDPGAQPDFSLPQ